MRVVHEPSYHMTSTTTNDHTNTSSTNARAVENDNRRTTFNISGEGHVMLSSSTLPL